MTIDTELNIYGDSANEFYKMMTSVDLNSIQLRDQFLADIQTQLDTNGNLIIDCPKLNIDLSCLDEQSQNKIEDVLTYERTSNYIDSFYIRISYDSSQAVKVTESCDTLAYKKSSAISSNLEYSSRIIFAA